MLAEKPLASRAGTGHEPGRGAGPHQMWNGSYSVVMLAFWEENGRKPCSARASSCRLWLLSLLCATSPSHLQAMMPGEGPEALLPDRSLQQHLSLSRIIIFFKYRTTVCTLRCHPELCMEERGHGLWQSKPLRGHVRPRPLPSCQAGGCSSAASGTRSCFCCGMF